MCPGSSRVSPALEPVPGLAIAAPPFSPAPQPRGSYLESRDGRREGPEERNHTATSVCPPTPAFAPCPSRPRTLRQGVSQTPALALGPEMPFPVPGPASWVTRGHTPETPGDTRPATCQTTCSARPYFLPCCSPCPPLHSPSRPSPWPYLWSSCLSCRPGRPLRC